MFSSEHSARFSQKKTRVKGDKVCLHRSPWAGLLRVSQADSTSTLVPLTNWRRCSDDTSTRESGEAITMWTASHFTFLLLCGSPPEASELAHKKRKLDFSSEKQKNFFALFSRALGFCFFHPALHTQIAVNRSKNSTEECLIVLIYHSKY